MKKAKNLMIQGTMSNVGKSLFAAGLLRALAQDGFLAAPFKARNTAFNSYITMDGLEMGRTQVMQAEAAGIIPRACMNPLLLKPSSNESFQVIVNGKEAGSVTADEYSRHKNAYLSEILNAYRRLEKEYDVIVLEGDGSPAELHRREDDFVNMGMARLVDAPVFLVGDIGRGGVFAQLYGSYALLEPKERARIKGFVMNKFRGDKKLLEPGIDKLYQKCRIPTVGVIPYTELDLEDEDSLAERFTADGIHELIDIAVIRLPHISSFADFYPLQNIRDVSLRYVSTPRSFGNPDLILLPGTKSVMHDLMWLREMGLEQRICQRVKEGTSLLLGICGGFQMLGMEIFDSNSVEQGGQIRGMGMLPLRITLGEMKIRSRVNGVVQGIHNSVFQHLSGSVFSGYEIHMGGTEIISGNAGEDFLSARKLERFSEITYLNEDGASIDGYVSGDCMGTYIHGIFEAGTFRNELLQLLFERKGLNWQGKNKTDYRTYKNRQYDMLAETVREHTDMKFIYHALGLA